jgi:uracil-DNA glycosylase
MGICVVSRSPRAGERLTCDLVVDDQAGAELQQALATAP